VTKSLPGMLMAAARLNLPTVFVYGGTILPGEHKGKSIDITTVFEAIGFACGRNDVGRGTEMIECAACPTEGQLRRDVHGQHVASISEADRHGASWLIVATCDRPAPR